ncbi:MAG: hypothetical protein AABX01_02195 [Candidatus Micrarchaeota archaeon]
MNEEGEKIAARRELRELMGNAMGAYQEAADEAGGRRSGSKTGVYSSMFFGTLPSATEILNKGKTHEKYPEQQGNVAAYASIRDHIRGKLMPPSATPEEIDILKRIVTGNHMFHDSIVEGSGHVKQLGKYKVKFHASRVLPEMTKAKVDRIRLLGHLKTLEESLNEIWRKSRIVDIEQYDHFVRRPVEYYRELVRRAINDLSSK